ncbi:DUF6445 family protein [Simiduia sp. 21SJ11W-1]|uniref:DUF6445 family protein n=1 Tax=Simiduia sp. 21SJ11W-1 TaxID=2909669 RepID=UPI0020A058A0|nr:DUF6445 family protein [Simiduia sp. 21SJ11W-1]UTA47726.1 DUF6445 family protein [Simiduia sp. 21SJ11W-1]
MDKSFLDISDNAKVTRLKVGQEQQPFLQIDAFMHDAGILRQFAIDKNAFSVVDTFYPGVRMPIPGHYAKALVHNLKDILEADFGCTRDRIKSCFSSYSMVTFSPDQLTVDQRIPHFDTLSTKSIAFVHYLCNGENTGTSLYRHKQTGYEYVDQSRVAELTQILRSQLGNAHATPKGYITKGTDIFDQVHTVNSEFNRIIGYRGSSLHSGNIPADANFSKDPAAGRLTITTLIEFD